MTDIETEIASWRKALQETAHLPEETIQELEDHLRDEIEALTKAGLRPDEALLIGFRRLGNAGELARSLAEVDADRLWKHLFDTGPSHGPVRTREVLWVIAAALLAALLGKIPLAFGVPMQGAGLAVYARNLSLFVAPILMAGFAVKQRFGEGIRATLFGLTLAAALAANLYPFEPYGDTSFLFALHLPLLLWLGMGLAYCGDDWRTVRAPVDFIRFTGEFVLDSVLILCGGVVFVGLIAVTCEALRIPQDPWIQEYVAFSGLLATPVVASYLVERKRSLIENLAPVLAKIFIPLFLVMITGFIVAMAVQRTNIVEDREMLIVIDVLLLLVVGMILYDLSARSEAEPFSFSHGMNLALIAAAIVVDVVALYGILTRLSDYGFTPNRTAALGENVLLLGNLIGLGTAYVRFALGRGNLSLLWRWQVGYLWVYAAWFLFAVFGFPPLFGFQ